MNFYSEFLAAVDVYTNYQDYFGDLVLDKPAPSSIPKVVATAKAGTSTKAKTTLVASKTSSSKSATASNYKVRNGDTLYDIAQRFGTSIRELMAKNNLSRPHIYAGQILLVR
jgi:LysM repeat protein